MRVTSAILALLPVAAATAAELKPETVAAWDGYIAVANARMQLRAQGLAPFLWIDEHCARARVRLGEPLILPATEHTPRRVPAGLIHHWIGAAFIPDAKIEDVTGVLRDYSRYKDYYRPNVIESKTIRREGPQDLFSLVLVNKALVVSTALEGDYESRYFQVDAKHSYSISQTTRVQEIENHGQASERKLPPDQGSGYIWRLYSITRFEERDGGVYLEVEAIALSRDIPAAVRWMVDPIVRRVSKSSVLTSLRQTQDAVNARFTVAATAAR